MIERIVKFIKSLLGIKGKPSVDLSTMTKAQLREYAESHGVKLPQRINKDRMIFIIQNEV
jgi:hypothetical protein